MSTTLREAIACLLLLLFVGLAMHGLTNLPVPVLAEPKRMMDLAANTDDGPMATNGEARESTKSAGRSNTEVTGNSRGGQSFPIVEIHTEKGIVSR